MSRVSLGADILAIVAQLICDLAARKWDRWKWDTVDRVDHGDLFCRVSLRQTRLNS